MKYFRVSVVTVKSLNLMFENRDKDKHKLVKGSNKDEVGIIFFKSGISDPFLQALACDHSQIFILYTNYVIQVYFTLIFVTKHIVIFKI